MAYFPPFKLLFLLTALLLIVDSGVNLKGKNRYDKSDKEQIVKESDDSVVKKQADMTYNDYCEKLTQEFKTLSERKIHPSFGCSCWWCCQYPFIRCSGRVPPSPTCAFQNCS